MLGARARAPAPSQIAWRRRAIGSARNQILRVVGATRQPILSNVYVLERGGKGY